MASTAGYGLPEPSEEYALQVLERMLGGEDARAVWERACAALGLAHPRAPLTRAQLHLVAQHLASQDDFIGVMGASLKIRLDTYDLLAPTIDPEQRKGADGATL